MVKNQQFVEFRKFLPAKKEQSPFFLEKDSFSVKQAFALVHRVSTQMSVPGDKTQRKASGRAHTQGD